VKEMPTTLNNPICLTKQEVKDITLKIQNAAQSRVLAEMGIPYTLRPDGSPLVLRHALEKTAGIARNKKLPQPDFSSLN
jgi:hypothetical protein